jgi:hypothetical protein
LEAPHIGYQMSPKKEANNRGKSVWKRKRKRKTQNWTQGEKRSGWWNSSVTGITWKARIGLQLFNSDAKRSSVRTIFLWLLRLATDLFHDLPLPSLFVP